MTYISAGLWDTVFQKVAILVVAAFLLGFIFSLLLDREGSLKDRLVNGLFQGIAGVGSSLGCIIQLLVFGLLVFAGIWILRGIGGG